MRAMQKEKAFVLLLGDITAMFIAMTLAFFFGYQSPAHLGLFPKYAWSIYTIIFFSAVIFFILDLYSLRKLPDIFLHQVPIIGLGLLTSSILATFAFFFFRNPIPRAVFILFYLFSFLLIVLSRILFNRLTMSSIFFNILLVGEKEPSIKIAELINDRKYLRSRVIGYISSDSRHAPPGDPLCLGCLDQLLPVLQKYKTSQVVVTTLEMSQQLNKLLLECMKRKIRVADYRWVMEDIAGTVPVDFLDDYWFILSLGFRDNTYFWYAKRSFDIMISLVGICLALPFLPLAALLIKLDSKGPVFYSQVRIGRGQRPFLVWKLRTMVNGADSNNVHWTTSNDQRITRVGRIIRKIRMDEVPQLLNVVKGEMSLIGPRPEAANLVELYVKEIPYYEERHRVTPGITGWAQINYPYGNSIEDTREKLKYDLFYIKHRSLLLDAVIFLKTIRIVLTGKGAI